MRKNAISLSPQELAITPSLYLEIVSREKKVSIVLFCHKNLLALNKMSQVSDSSLKENIANWYRWMIENHFLHRQWNNWGFRQVSSTDAKTIKWKVEREQDVCIKPKYNPHRFLANLKWNPSLKSEGT